MRARNAGRRSHTREKCLSAAAGLLFNKGRSSAPRQIGPQRQRSGTIQERVANESVHLIREFVDDPMRAVANTVDAAIRDIFLEPKDPMKKRTAHRRNPQWPLPVCAVTRRRFPVGASPTRQPLQPEATGTVIEAASRLNGASLSNHDSSPGPSKAMAFLAVGTSDSADDRKPTIGPWAPEPQTSQGVRRLYQCHRYRFQGRRTNVEGSDEVRRDPERRGHERFQP